MTEVDLNQTEMAKRCGCSARKVNEIVNGKRVRKSLSQSESALIE